VIRREVLSKLVVALVSLLLAAQGVSEAQPSTKPIRLGYLSFGSAETPGLAPVRHAFAEGLRDLGYVVGDNIVIEYGFAAGARDRLPERANELVRLQPDVLIGEGFEAAAALKRATATIPIVMFACDALAGGLVSSLARPGGNVTGITCITSETGGKRLELLRELVPIVSRIAVLWNSADPAKRLELDGMFAAAASRSLNLHPFDVQRAEDIGPAFEAARRERAQALLVLGDAFTVIHRRRIAELALTSRLPAMYSFREFVNAGGLMSYGPNAPQLFRRLASYVDRVLKGARPADLPIEQPTTFELIINLKTARALGLTIPPSLLLRADQAIE
jgi:putative ABC transport system substrate-binding protein